jgi:5-methylcytosine-specific restriction endonuclease McrA
MINWRRKDFNTPPLALYNDIRLNALREAERLLDGDQILSGHYNFAATTNLLKAYSLDQDAFNTDTDLAKCYYCESTSEVVAALQVEHYRPKKRVDDQNRQAIPQPEGYYWLGIEWTNLVLACSKCNGRGAKGNIFTVGGPRVISGTNFSLLNVYNRVGCIANVSPLIDEQPDLLHPEIDNAYYFIGFNSDGKIYEKHHRGKRTINICKLDRTELNIARNKLISSFRDSFWEVIEWHRNNFIATDQVLPLLTTKCLALKNRHVRSQPYTLLVRYMLEEFESFFVDFVPDEYKNDLRQALINS